MGKVHRIKKSFRRLVAHQPVQAGTHCLAGIATIHLGRSYGGTLYASIVYGRRYEKLVQMLMREYNERAV